MSPGAPNAPTDAMVRPRQTPDGSVEIKLSPEELGRVRMTVSPGDAEVTISVMAERGETLDLLRRNADILSAELRNAGFERLSLDFGQSMGSGSDANPSSDQPGLDPPDETADTQDTPEPSAPSHPLADTTRVDIRL